MLKTNKVLFLSALVAAAAFGQNQVATVSSPSTFTLRGASVNPGQGVPDWPVLARDTIQAGTSPTTVTFPDGSTITLNPGAEATVNLNGQTPVFRLLKGSAQYALKTLTSVQLMSGNQVVALTSLAGSLGKTGGLLAGVGAAVGAHTGLAILAAGAAAGLGAGVSEATSGGSSVSPSH